MSYQTPDEKEKPSWYSTEFIFAVVTSLVSVAVLMGWMPQTDVETVNGLIKDTIETVGVLLVNGATIWQYIKSRTEVKKVREELKVLQVRERLMQK